MHTAGEHFLGNHGHYQNSPELSLEKIFKKCLLCAQNLVHVAFCHKSYFSGDEEVYLFSYPLLQKSISQQENIHKIYKISLRKHVLILSRQLRQNHVAGCGVGLEWTISKILSSSISEPNSFSLFKSDLIWHPSHGFVNWLTRMRFTIWNYKQKFSPCKAMSQRRNTYAEHSAHSLFLLAIISGWSWKITGNGNFIRRLQMHNAK